MCPKELGTIQDLAFFLDVLSFPKMRHHSERSLGHVALLCTHSHIFSVNIGCFDLYLFTTTGLGWSKFHTLFFDCLVVCVCVSQVAHV